MNKEKDLKALGVALLVATFFTFVMFALLQSIGIPLNVVLPTSAPIWMGIWNMMFILLR